mgnify:CR=1 FL=1
MAQKRQTRTEAKIKAAYTRIVKAKGFDALTVSDLAREADINRGTFYMHYVDKFDLRQQLIDDTIDELTSILIPKDASADALEIGDIIRTDDIVEALRYIKRDYEFIDAVSNGGTDMQLHDRIKDVIRQLLLSQVSRLRTPPSGFADFPQEYAQEILVSAVTSILWLWIRRRCRESPETICDIIERNKVTAPIDILR